MFLVIFINWLVSAVWFSQLLSQCLTSETTAAVIHKDNHHIYSTSKRTKSISHSIRTEHILTSKWMIHVSRKKIKLLDFIWRISSWFLSGKNALVWYLCCHNAVCSPTGSKFMCTYCDSVIRCICTLSVMREQIKYCYNTSLNTQVHHDATHFCSNIFLSICPFFPCSSKCWNVMRKI